jgi:penicillin-binding protein 1C
MVSVRSALASSLNIPAVKAVEMVGIGNFLQTLNQLGLNNLEREDFYGPSIALGSADVRLIELVNAYRTLANKGQWSPIRWTANQHNNPELNHRVFTEEASFLIADILSDREARSSTFGLENMLATRFWTAVKTGTSKDMRDNWCIGFSSKYTVGVWTGNFSGSPMWNVSGIQGAAPVWLEIMNNLHQNDPSLPPLAPKGVIQKRVDFTFLKQKRLEKFIIGTEPPDGKISLGTKATSKIAYPQSSSYIALDPDIPVNNQKVFFNISNPGNGHRILLNKTDLGPAKPFILWHPQKGKFQLELKDRMGMTIDQVEFEVRGRYN